MRTVILDYGLCNLLSVHNALKFLGIEALVTGDPEALRSADRAILPGVGAFADGMRGLRSKGLVGPIHAYVRTGRPFLGICLGMQFLMTKSHEFGEHEGLGIIPGETVNLKDGPQAQGLRVPHIGWNGLHDAGRPWEGTLLAGLPQGAEMYFVHSFHTVPADPSHALAVTEYGPRRFCSVIARDNVHGCQFHPEKSAALGLKILKNFVDL